MTNHDKQFKVGDIKSMKSSTERCSIEQAIFAGFFPDDWGAANDTTQQSASPAPRDVFRREVYLLIIDHLRSQINAYRSRSINFSFIRNVTSLAAMELQ